MEETKQKAEDLSLEEAFEQLDKLAERLETRGISLEESFTTYQEGMELLKLCNEKIDRVEKKMLQVNEKGEFSEF